MAQWVKNLLRGAQVRCPETMEKLSKWWLSATSMLHTSCEIEMETGASSEVHGAASLAYQQERPSFQTKWIDT
jgi:1,2-phenylacetyl-CoA epoxidase catalytic subunit